MTNSVYTRTVNPRRIQNNMSVSSARDAVTNRLLILAGTTISLAKAVFLCGSVYGFIKAAGSISVVRCISHET